MTLNDEEKRVESRALQFARAHKSSIARRRTDKDIFKPESNPVSVFMAGSPGAGKTEASIELLDDLASEVRVLRIDPDELRDEFEEYRGGNSYLFQKGVSILVEKIHDFALKQKQSFVMDGTLANRDKASQNIERSLGKGRVVQILYVYQDPVQAWEFVKAREMVEGRRIPEKYFIEQYFGARDTVVYLKKEFGKKLRVDLLIKNLDNSNRSYRANVGDIEIDKYVAENYTPAALERALRIV